ncbi:hypothetical protein RvY_16072-2 [Ramazzottius varieornatus]|uniref:Uncharacterized protein n=1 Tax=Ramazzottius varieornatus TaxID=947166 RepID=A0A1D1W057_RAMVA|nr:hypothetical protein RvY_16072-2 [Ramazzottius varieornatus]
MSNFDVCRLHSYFYRWSSRDFGKFLSEGFATSEAHTMALHYAVDPIHVHNHLRATHLVRPNLFCWYTLQGKVGIMKGTLEGEVWSRRKRRQIENSTVENCRKVH